MERFSISTQAKPYVEALRALIGPGIGSAHLEESLLIELPAVTATAGTEASAGVRASAFIELLNRVINDRLVKNDRRVAKILFGIDEWAGTSARDRHYEAAKTRNKNWSWENNYRKEPLIRDLYMIFLALYREGDRTVGEVTEATRPGKEQVAATTYRRGRADNNRHVGGDYSVVSYDLTYNLPARSGERREFLYAREITALGDGVETFRQSSHWWGKDITSRPELALFGPGRLTITHDGPYPRSDQPARIYVAEVKFPKPLQKGERAKFAIVKTQDVPFEELVRDGWRDSYGLFGVVVPIERATINIRFPEAVQPRTVWHFEDLPDWLAPGTPTEATQLEPDGSGYVTYNWTNLTLGSCYGLAWEW